MAAGELDRALRDGEEAVRLNPQSMAWKNNRGECFIKRKEYDKAIAEFMLCSTPIPVTSSRSTTAARHTCGRDSSTRRSRTLKQALQNEAKVPGLHMNLARALATSPDAKLRDGKRALEAAKKAVDMIKYRDGRYLDTLAAAYAEAGDFDKAVETQQKAIDDPELMKDDEDGARKRLKLYREKMPFRDE